MPSPSDLSWYASQSAVTNPGGLASLLADLLVGVDGLRQVARGLVVHYRDGNPLEAGIPQARLAEIDSRYGEAMLARLAELQEGSLLDARSPTEPLVGCCRDFTVLLLAMARASKIPARARVGFARYFVSGVAVDQAWSQSRRNYAVPASAVATPVAERSPSSST